MSTTWNVVCTALPAIAALPVAGACIALACLLQHRRPHLIALRAAAVLAAAALLADPAVSRTTVVDEPPPVALVVDVSASMATVDRRLPADRLLDLAILLGEVDSTGRTDAPRRMAALLAEVQARLPLAASLPAERLRADADALDGIAGSGVGYRDAERLCRDTARALRTAAADNADGGRAADLAPLIPIIADLLPRLAEEQAAGDAALLAHWRGEDGDPQRTVAVGRIATAERGALAKRLVGERIMPALASRARLACFTIADDLVPVDAATLATGRGATDFAALGDLARGWSTDRTPGAVVLISDGRNLGGDPRPALRALAARGARLLLVGLGDTGDPDIPALVDLAGPALARTGARIALDARVRGAGPGWEIALAADGTEVARQPLAGGSGAETALRLETAAGAPGLRRFAARLERPGMAPGPWLPCPVRVADGALRVVVVDSLPRWETRALVAALEADPAVAVERRYLQGPGAVAQALPDEALRQADAVVLGDLSAAELGPEDQARLAAFVADGGFLVAVAGPRGMPGAFPLGPLADLLPVRPVRGSPGLAASFALTTAGAAHPLGRLLGDTDRDRRLWAALPSPGWSAAAVAARPGADVLAEIVTGPSSAAPAVVVRSDGLGRVLWLGTPETWRWRTFDGGRAHTGFWRTALAWGVAARPRGADPRLRVALAPERIDPQETTELTAICAEQPLVELIGEDGARTPLAVEAMGSGRWRATLGGLPEGLQRVTVHAGDLTEERDLLVRPRAWRELADPAADLQALRALAADCGGEAVDAAGLAAALDRLPLAPQAITTTRTWTATGNPWIALALIACLIAEWVLRKRSGLP